MHYKKEIRGKTCYAEFSGRVTFSENEKFRDLLETINRAQISELTIELNGVEFIDSASLGLLLKAKKQCDVRSIRLVLKNLSDPVQKTFETASFYSIFTVE